MSEVRDIAGEIVTSLSGAANGFPRETGFDITVSSEVMAVLCLTSGLADLGRRLGNIVVGRNRGHLVGMRCLAAAKVEHTRLRARQIRHDRVGHIAIVHVLVAGIDIDRVRAVPEREPVGGHARHSASNGPSGPNTGSASGGGTCGMTASACACSALLPRQRL